jgi:predicted DNA-binding antitoxin AbrB/MazE fold protein
MTTIIAGIVTNGVVVPKTPLPEGAQVDIYLNDAIEVSSELQEELAAWQQGSAEALALVERLANERDADEAR